MHNNRMCHPITDTNVRKVSALYVQWDVCVEKSKIKYSYSCVYAFFFVLLQRNEVSIGNREGIG